MNTIRLFFIVVLCWSCSVFAQQWTEYSVESTSSTVRSEHYLSLKDARGREWYISDNKLDCREGENWSHYNYRGIDFDYVEGYNVNGYFISADSSLWIHMTHLVLRIEKNKTITAFDTATFHTTHPIGLWVANDQVVVAPEYPGQSGSYHKNLFFFNGTTWIEQTFEEGKIIHQEKTGLVWYQTPIRLIQIHSSGYEQTVIPPVSQLKFQVRSSANEAWFSDGNRFIRMEGAVFHFYSEMNGTDIESPNGNIVVSNGEVWACINDNKLGRFNGTSWTIITTPHNPNNGIVACEGKIFYKDAEKLWAYGTSETEVFLPNSPVYPSLTFEASSNTILYNDPLKRLYKWENGNWALQENDAPGKLPAERGDKSILILYGRLTVTYWDGSGLFYYNGSTWDQAPNRGADGLRSDNIASVAVDPLSNVWFATPRGLSVLVDNSEWGHVSYPSVINYWESGISEIEIDENNTIWGLYAAGLLKYDGNTWTAYDTALFHCNRIFEIEPDHHGAIWVNTPNGIRRLNPVTGAITFYPLKYLSYPQTLVKTPDHEMCALDFSTTSPVMHVFNNNTWTSLPLNLPTATTYISRRVFVTKDKNNVIWVKRIISGYEQEIYKLENQNLILQNDLGFRFSELYFDSKNTLWSYLEDGVVSYSDTFSQNTDITDMCIDPFDNIWVAGHKAFKLSFLTTETDAPTTVQETWSLYPVPAEDELTIEGEFETALVRIVNTLGIEVLRQTYTKGQPLDVSSLKTGVYYLQFPEQNTISSKCFSKK